MKSTVKHFGNLQYRNDGWREVTSGNGFFLCVDKNGNGEPFFNIKTKEGRQAFGLWRKIENNGRQV